MASIPLPALDVRAPQQPDIMGQYGKLMQLKAMQQQMANAPLQTQALQQQVQSGQLGIQQQQQALKDQQAMTAAMQGWDGKDINSLVPLVIKNGASATAVMGLKSKILEQKQQFSQIAANDATTGSKNIETLKNKNDMVGGALSTVMSLPDNQLAQGLVQTAQNLAQQGVLDPQHLQIAQQIAQIGDPAQIRQKLDVLRKSSMSQSQLLDEAAKTAQTNEANVNTAKTQAEMGYYAQNGGAPGVPTELMQQADWLRKNPGKGPSDYKLWTLQHTPSAMIMGNMLGGPNNSDALDFAANNYRLTGQMPAGLYRSPGTTQAIIARAAQLDQQSGGSGIAANKATLQANTKSLDNLQKNYDQVQAFEQTASKNMDLLQQTAQNIPDLGVRYANIPVRMLNSRMLGTENMAAFKTALNTAQTEAAKVLNSSNASGVLSDSARHELQDIIDGNVSYKAMVASLNTLKQDMNNRTQSYQMQIGDIQNRIKGAGSSTAPQQPSAGSGALKITRDAQGRIIGVE